MDAATGDGPFRILCGHRYKHYLDILESSGTFILCGTRDDTDASAFSIERNTTNGRTVYRILYDQDMDMPVYLARNKKALTGEKSLQLGAGKPVKLALHHSTKTEAELSIKVWEAEPCYVRILGSSKETEGYVGYNEETDQLELVQDLEKEERGNMWLQLRLERIKRETDAEEEDDDDFTPAGPRRPRPKPPPRFTPNTDCDSD